MRDVLIAGGGPAGLAAAIRARQRGLSCAIVEPKPPPIDKACGEGLMPAALALLDELGVEAPAGHPFVGIRYLDAVRPQLSAEGDFAQPGRGVRRTELYERLHRRAVELDVERIEGCIERVEQHPGHVEADGEKARYLIGADGLHSHVRREVGIEAHTGEDPRFGVRRHYEVSPWADRVEVYWSPRGEAYVTPVDDEAVGVAFLAEGGGRFDDFLPHFPHLAERLDGATPISEDRGGGPFEHRLERRVAGRVLLVGDAAGYLDPLTGEGVALALSTARAAVDALADDAPERYEERYTRLTRTYWWMTGLLLHVSRRRWLHRPMLELLDRAPHLFDGCLHLLGGVERDDEGIR
ncbi:MAG: NAD(P)/FAD-dependent oxidoreductase [Persicimonas sp.]